MGNASVKSGNFGQFDELDTNTINSYQFGSEKPANKTLARNRIEYDAWVGAGIEHNRKLSARLRVRAGSEYLDDTDYSIVDRVAARLAGCHNEEWVQRDPEGNIWLASTSRCMTRLCPICAANRTRKFQDRLDHWFENGMWWIDGNGKLRGNRDIEEIGEAAAASLNFAAAIRPGEYETVISELLAKADREAQHRQISLFSHLITLTIPNIPHVWDYAALEPNLLDIFILEPFRRMMTVAKQWRLKHGDQKHKRITRSHMRRATKNAKKAIRVRWSWKRPRGRHYILGISFIAAIRGYARVLEITVNRRERTFHPHLHFLAIGDRPYIPQGIVRHLWRHYTDNPAITQVDVRKADPATIGNELVKYLTKINDITDSAMLQEIVRATYRRRMIQMGGIMFGPKFSRYQWEKAKADRLARQPIAETGVHIRRHWNPRTHAYDQKEFRSADKDVPIKTGEQWQTPQVQTPDGETVSRFGRDQFLARQAARHLPVVSFTSRMKWVIAVEVRRQKEREEAEGRLRSEEAYQSIRDARYQERLKIYLTALVFGSLLAWIDKEEAA